MSTRRFSSYAGDLLRITPICAGIIVAGCGGSGGMAGQAAAPSGTSQAGNATAMFSGKPHPMVESSIGSVSAFSQAGASFTNFQINPTASLATTSLAYSRNVSGAGTQAYVVPADGSAQPNFLVHTTLSLAPSFSNSGLMAILTQVGGQYSIQTMLQDGTGAHVVLSNVFGLPTISPNGQTIAYYNVTNHNIYTIPSAGGTSTLVYSGGSVEAAPVIWSKDGTRLAFSALNPAAGHYDPFVMPAAGGVATDVLPVSYQGNGDGIPSSWSPDGLSLACSWIPTVGTDTGMMVISMNGGGSELLTPSGFSDLCPCFSPDNKKIAFYRSNAGGAQPGIYEGDFTASNPQMIIPDPSSSGPTGTIETLTWSMFQPIQKFVGVGGSITTSNVAGYVMAQTNNKFASLVAMTATTPSSATITPVGTTTSGGPLVYKFSADAITNISFANIYQGAHTSINLTTTASAFVSIDGANGLVDFVAPGVFKKGSGSTFSGQFTAIYDRTGKNIAPAGASSIEVDHSTGKLLSFH